MTCPACGRQQPGASRFCTFCDAFQADAAHAARPSLVRRVAGFLVDLLAWGVALFAMLLAGLGRLGGGDGDGGSEFMMMIAALILFTQLAFFFRAKTIGKAILGLEVRYERSGERADTLRMIVREMLSQTVSMIFGLGYVWAFVDPDRQTLHDRLTNTMVVRRLKQPRMVPVTATGSPAAEAPVVAAIPARPTFSLDGLYTLVPPRYVAGALGLAALVFLGSEMRANAPPPDHTKTLSRALQRLSDHGDISDEALALAPNSNDAKILWVRYAASVDVAAAVDSALAAHGVPDGFGPPFLWLSERYLGSAADHAAIGEHWPRYMRFHDSFAARLPELARAAVQRRAEEAALGDSDRRTLLSYVDMDLRAHVDLWQRRRALAELAATLHQTLIDAEPALTPAEAMARREFIRTRVAFEDLQHWDRMRHSNKRAVLVIQ